MVDQETQSTETQQEQTPKPKIFTYDVAAQSGRKPALQPNPNSPLAAG